MKFERIAIAGAGAFGTALALVAARAGRDVVLWGRDARQIQAMRATRENDRASSRRDDSAEHRAYC